MVKQKKKRKANQMTIDGLTITEKRLQYQHDGWSCGYGFHESKKYSRKVKHKGRQDW